MRAGGAYRSAARAPAEPEPPAPEPFPKEEIVGFVESRVNTLRDLSGFEEIANALSALLDPMPDDLEQLEQRLTSLEQKMIATARVAETDEETFAARQELALQLQPYRRKMSAPQLDMLERQFLERKLLERRGLPRLSLFYLR